MRKLIGLFASTMIVFAACQGAATPSPSTASTAPAPSTATGGASPSAGGSTAPEKVDLTHTAYKPDPAAKDGGTLIIGDWQEANQFNPFYLGQVTEANVASAVWSSLVVLTNDYKYAPDLASDIPTTDNGGVKVPGDGSDAMTVTWKLRPNLKWSDGQPLTCDDYKSPPHRIMAYGNT